MAKIITLIPASGIQGQTLDGVQITGQSTHFDDTSTVTFSNSGITASNIAPVSATQLTATLAIGVAAATGLSDVTVTTGTEIAVGAALFGVTAKPAGTWGSISPANAAQGGTVTVEITGQNTTFDATSAATFTNPGITVDDAEAISPTRLKVDLTIDAAAPLPACDVTVTTGSEVITGISVFGVIPSEQRLEILREAVSSYLRTNHVTGAAKDICQEFIASINDQLRVAATKAAAAAPQATAASAPVHPATAPVQPSAHQPPPQEPLRHHDHHEFPPPQPPPQHNQERKPKHKS